MSQGPPLPPREQHGAPQPEDYTQARPTPAQFPGPQPRGQQPAWPPYPGPQQPWPPGPATPPPLGHQPPWPPQPPPPAPWVQPPPPAPRPPRRGWLTGCLVALAVIVALPLAIGTLALVLGEDPQPEPSSFPGHSQQPQRSTLPDPTPTTRPEPSQFSLPPLDLPPLPEAQSADPVWKKVQQTRLYSHGFPETTGCPEPAIPQTWDLYVQYMQAQLDCTQAAWRPVLKSLGLPSHGVPVYFVNDSTISSDCSTSAVPAHYCSLEGGSIYFGVRAWQDAKTLNDPLWLKMMVLHEYGHHLQGVSGFYDVFYELPQTNETMRRWELQATCLAAGTLRKDPSYPLTQENYRDLLRHLTLYTNDGIHGSRESLTNWGRRGYYAQTTGACNTWVAGSADIQ